MSPGELFGMLSERFRFFGVIRDENEKIMNVVDRTGARISITGETFEEVITKALELPEPIMKKCRGPCGKSLPLESFSPRTTGKNARDPVCRFCVAKRVADYEERRNGKRTQATNSVNAESKSNS